MIGRVARHPTAANLIMVAIMILGLVTLPGLKKETFPEIESDQIEVRVVYPGATTEDIEDSICRRIEEALESIADLEELRCDAREGVGTVTALKREGVAMARFLDDVKTEVEAIDNFPDQAEVPITKELGRTDKVISIAITGPEEATSLKAYAEALKARMLALQGVANISVNGFSARQIRIEIPRWRLRQYGLSAGTIADAIGRNSITSPGGRIEGDTEDLLLRINEQRKTVDEFRDLIVISGSSGASIRLGEIAEITDRFERAEEKILFNNQRAAVLDIEKTKDDDIVEVYQAINQFVAQERRRAPSGISLTLTQDRASVVQDRLDMLLRNGAQGLVLVFLVLWLFFSMRYSFWVTMGLPVSFLGALFLLPVFSISINMISMVGLLIGIGLLMDDAIVIAENIAARMAKGDTAMQAAIDGVKQVLPGILSSFATTLLVFGSLAFITGEIGQILRVMPVVLILVISVSLIEAIFVLPSHLGHSLSHMRKSRPQRFRVIFERGFTHLRERWFGPALDFAIDYRYLTLGLALMLMIIAISMPAGGQLKFVGFPEIDGDIIEARLLLPQGTPLQRTEQLVEQIKTRLQAINDELSSEQPGGQDLVRNITVIYGQNPDAFETGPHLARIVVDLLSAEQRSTSIDELLRLWRSRVGDLADVIAVKFAEPSIGPGGRAIDLRLLGSDLEQLKAASLELQDWLNSYAGVLDLGDDLRPGKRELRLRLKPGAGVLGIDTRTLAEQIRGAFQGIQIDEFPLDVETFEVDLRLLASDRDGPQDLDNMFVLSAQGAQVPLSVVAEIEEVRGWARIHRIDGGRAITIQGDVDRQRANTQELIGLVQNEFIPGLLERYPGIRFDVQGESEESRHTGQSIVRNVLLGMIGVYMLLALQFRGYVAPLTVMAIIPTSLIGVIFGHMALGLDLTMPSIVGMASLFGVVVNDSILLVVFIRDARKRGVPVFSAARQAGRDRFRPIVLTSITTIAGLLPLLAETSLQAQILIPLAASLAFGLSSATLIALFLVPAIYCILDDFNLLGQLHAEDDEDVAVGSVIT